MPYPRPAADDVEQEAFTRVLALRHAAYPIEKLCVVRCERWRSRPDRP